MIITVKVIPHAPKTEFRGTMADGAMKIAVAATPEKGKANAELIRFLAEYFLCAKECVSIKSGLTSNKKIIKIIKN